MTTATAVAHVTDRTDESPRVHVHQTARKGGPCRIPGCRYVPSFGHRDPFRQFGQTISELPGKPGRVVTGRPQNPTA